jgi:hypothetical protein
MKPCKCELSLGNLGTTSCNSSKGVVVTLLMQPTFDSTGARNFIDTTAPALLTQAFWDANVNNPDATKRLYPLANLLEPSNVRGADEYQTFADKSKYKTSEGIREFKAFIPEVGSIFLGKLKQAGCTKFQVYLVGADGQIVGNGAIDGKLYGIKVNQKSFSAIEKDPTPTTIGGIDISFEFSRDEKDEDLRQITAEELQNVDVLGFDGLLDVNATFTAITATSFVMDLAFDYGSVVKKQPMVGVTTPDVTLYNVTDSASITVTSVAPDLLIKGRYLVTMPSQTSADVLRATIVRNGFDFSSVSNQTIIVP